MKTEYEHIRFLRKGARWGCQNKASAFQLDQVFYYWPWKEWVSEPTVGAPTGYSAGCVRDIAEFLAQLNERAAKWRKSPSRTGGL